jgi:molybdopterin/thiamine biosynthesis adenylyltransferase
MVKVNYAVVFNRTAQCKDIIKNQLNTTNQNYNKLLDSTKTMDSATNAAFIETVELDRQKAEATARILEKLLSFVEGTTTQVECQENKITQQFTRADRRRV